ncbi:MAG: hypothetical protein JW841_06540 [Deltaproteobacteria bacterium]|nr:hypothetical protein [Deltaproteobacteria bacterium]
MKNKASYKQYIHQLLQILVVIFTLIVGAGDLLALQTPPVLLIEYTPLEQSLNKTILNKYLSVYLNDIPHQIVKTKFIDNIDEQRQVALRLAKQHSSTYVAWWSSLAVDIGVRFSACVMVVNQIDAKPLAVEVNFNSNQINDSRIYRLAAIKLRSALRTAMMLHQEDANHIEQNAQKTLPTLPLALANENDAHEKNAQPAKGVGIELIAMGSTLTLSKTVIPSFGGLIFWAQGSWLAGISGTQSLRHHEITQTGAGNTAVTRFAALGRYYFAQRIAGGMFSFFTDLESGVLYFRTDTKLHAGETMPRHLSTLLPFISVGVGGVLHTTSHFDILLHLGADVLRKNLRILVLKQPVYQSGWVQPNLAIAIATRF